MAPTQRTKSGCWTCRLRRKKCSEGGPPCGTCEARQIFCHGYGRKPDWKDKGEKERQEAMRLQLEARGNEVRDTAVPSDRPSSSSSRNKARDAAVGPEPPSTVSSPPLASRQPTGPEEIFFNMDWSPEMASSFSNDFTFFSSPTANIGDNDDLEVQQPVLFADNPANNAMSAGSERLSSDAGSSLHDLPLSIATTESQSRVDKEMDLIMHYISHFCSSNMSTGPRASSTSRGWLLFVLTRSPAFYNASLGISAYQQHHTSPQDDTPQSGLYHDYQEYRSQAARLFSVLKHCGICSFPGEDLVCAVQLSRLEALAGNIQNCQSYMASAKSAMLSGERMEMTRPDPPDTSVIPRPLSPLSSILSSTSTGNKKPPKSTSFGSAMERKAIAVSQCLVVWNDLLACSIQKKVPAAHETYPTWFSDTESMALLQETTGCEPWVLKAISDTTLLETWRKDQEARGALSIRALAGRADKIEAAVADGIQRIAPAGPGSPAVPPSSQTSGRRASSASSSSGSPNHVPSHTHTSIFAHAVTTYLHIVVSGPKPGISEIGHSIDRAIESWKAFLDLLLALPPPAAGTIREWPLAWPLCTTASLATGAQRDFFRGMMADLSSSGSDKTKTMMMTPWAARTVSECKTVIEKCWQEVDQQASDGAPTCDWRDVFQRCGFCHLFS
ncbi:hypothetical protein PG993_006204 [Apiospora rasikravindrae]|uniref:Zn(2)-C6 fungal-type domain-containing protein n=1 Tax=Apiospora rasikravindrae TaxID=990691 RepID=A0ABR1T518_9PEZI